MAKKKPDRTAAAIRDMTEQYKRKTTPTLAQRVRTLEQRHTNTEFQLGQHVGALVDDQKRLDGLDRLLSETIADHAKQGAALQARVEGLDSDTDAIDDAYNGLGGAVDDLIKRVEAMERPGPSNEDVVNACKGLMSLIENRRRSWPVRLFRAVKRGAGKIADWFRMIPEVEATESSYNTDNPMPKGKLVQTGSGVSDGSTSARYTWDVTLGAVVDVPPTPCGFTPPTPGYAPCTRNKGHDGPCAHPLADATFPAFATNDLIYGWKQADESAAAFLAAHPEYNNTYTGVKREGDAPQQTHYCPACEARAHPESADAIAKRIAEYIEKSDANDPNLWGYVLRGYAAEYRAAKTKLNPDPIAPSVIFYEGGPVANSETGGA